MRSYSIVTDVRDDSRLRESFFDFVNAIFPGLNFRKWFEMGFWTDEYVPHAIVEDNVIVSNAAISKMRLVVNGEEKSGIQIGTVGTIPEYRGIGLSRRLMEYILEKYEPSTDLFFLYADDDVLDFYPKFGFRRCDGSVFESKSDLPSPVYSARKLNIDDEADLKLLRGLIENRLDLTRVFGARDYGFVTFWHLINLHPENMYYVEEDDAVFILSEKSGCLNVWEVIHRSPIEVRASLAKAIKSEGLERIRYHFPPDQLEFSYDSVERDTDMPLFIRGGFPIEDRPFKHPATAQT